MSSDVAVTKETLDLYLKELGKAFRKRNGKAMQAEIILIGGAAILANYGFRQATFDVDAVIYASSAMKEAVNYVGDHFGLRHNWLNMDFQRTSSYSDKLSQVSVYYRTFSNVLTVRTVTAEYLIAMKLKSGREYKFDLSDIVGILSAHEETGCPIQYEDIDRAVTELYGGWQDVPESSKKFLQDTFANSDYSKIYQEIRESEKEAKQILLDFDQKYPTALTPDNLQDILEKARKKEKNSADLK